MNNVDVNIEVEREDDGRFFAVAAGYPGEPMMYGDTPADAIGQTLEIVIENEADEGSLDGVTLTVRIAFNESAREETP